MENTQGKKPIVKDKKLSELEINMLKKLEEKFGGKIVHVSHKQNYKNENSKQKQSFTT